MLCQIDINTRRKTDFCLGIVAWKRRIVRLECCHGIYKKVSIIKYICWYKPFAIKLNQLIECIYFSTTTAGICTNWTGDLPSFNACVRFSIWPRITDICLSNRCLSNPLSCCNSNNNNHLLVIKISAVYFQKWCLLK